ncbi:hypothetical protein LCGC14_2877330, partial [marine sediment metagenome]
AGELQIIADTVVTGTLSSGVITQGGTTLANTYQPLDAELTSLAGLTYAAASFIKMTGANAFALRTIGETADDLEGTIDHANLANLTIAAHDTTATGANLTSLTDNSIADTLHRHSELVASDGTPDPVVSIDAAGFLGVGLTVPRQNMHLHSGNNGTKFQVSNGITGSDSDAGFLFQQFLYITNLGNQETDATADIN